MYFFRICIFLFKKTMLYSAKNLNQADNLDDFILALNVPGNFYLLSLFGRWSQAAICYILGCTTLWFGLFR
ncbi:hypothetical protein DSUL_140086 [Desulfovibrionales bacterium]